MMILVSIGEGPYIIGATPPVTLGAAYLATLTAGGGRPPFTYSLLSGSAALAALGLAFTDNGDDTAKIDSAETTNPGTAEFTVEVIDADRIPGVRTFTVQVIALPLTVGFDSLPDAVVGVPYVGQLSSAGGVGTPEFSLPDKPSWMTVNAGTGALGGTPDVEGTALNVTAQAEDDEGNTAQASDTLDVAEAPWQTYLDSITPEPVAVLSLHKLYSDATTAIRVRRSSDNAEQDIGFDGFDLDVDALLTFAGAGSAYVTTVYDQSGNGNNAVQTTAANQPRIVNSGAYDGEMVFDGSNDSLAITSLAQGSAYLAAYMRIRQPHNATNKIIFEASTNYNSASQAFTCYAGITNGDQIISMNASNAAGSQRALQYGHPNYTQLAQLSALWDRSKTGTSEMLLYAEGDALTLEQHPATVEQTGSFSSYDVYIGARGGASLFNAFGLETLVFYNADTESVRDDIEYSVLPGEYYWETRMNAPTFLTKIDGTYFLVEAWHHRVLYTDDVTKPPFFWSVMDDTNLAGPHSIAWDGYMYVVDDTESERVCTYKSDGAGGFTLLDQVLVADTNLKRPHRVQYDSGTSAFYVINGGTPSDGITREMVKLTRSGDTLSVVDTSDLTFMNQGYSRGFNIIDGKMYIVAESATVGKVFEVSFDSTPTYTLDATYDLPTGWESPNDVYKGSDGKWYVTAEGQKILRGDSLALIDAGTYTDLYATYELGGTPYYLSEFDGAMWIPEIVERNGITKVVSDVPELIHDYGTENADSLDRHDNPPA